MPRITIDFNDELHQFIKNLIKEGSVNSFQEITMKGLQLYLKQMGVEEIEKLPEYILKLPYTKSYTKKVQIEDKKEGSYTKSCTNDSQMPTRSRMRNSMRQRQEEAEESNQYADLDDLIMELKKLTDRNKWEEARYLADLNEQFREQLLDFYNAYNER